MARRPRRLTPRQRLEQLAEQFEPILQAAFLEAVADLVSNVEVARVIERLERGDIDGALTALHIDPVAFRSFEEALRQAYIGGGSATIGGMPVLREPDGSRLVLRFDARAPGAESYLRTIAGTEITGTGLGGRIAQDTLSGARTIMERGMIDGRNPRSVALDLAGRINRATGRRTGSIIGLTSRHMETVDNVRRELLSGDEAAMRHYLSLNRSDKRGRDAVLRAIRERKALDAATVQGITGRLSDSYLLLRGETIARTEMLTALAASQREAYEQAIASGAVNRQDVRKIWRSTRDARVRDTHRQVDSESVGMDERFSNGLLYPHEPGAPASEVVNCRCAVDYRIDFMANLT